MLWIECFTWRDNRKPKPTNAFEIQITKLILIVNEFLGGLRGIPVNTYSHQYWLHTLKCTQCFGLKYEFPPCELRIVYIDRITENAFACYLHNFDITRWIDHVLVFASYAFTYLVHTCLNILESSIKLMGINFKDENCISPTKQVRSNNNSAFIFDA